MLAYALGCIFLAGINGSVESFVAAGLVVMLTVAPAARAHVSNIGRDTCIDEGICSAVSS